MSARHFGEYRTIIGAAIRMTDWMTGCHIRLCSEFRVEALSVRIVLPHRHHLHIVHGVRFIGLSQSMANFFVFHNPVILMLEELCSFPLGWQPVFETCQSCICSAVGILEHPIPEASVPP